ncbi:YaaC family protein [Tumebacillus permanentifrigoris]|uniref:YaaC-like protein n=1 Tax=Tumebacillus permanentifrigoris TaxID=378543 RepID=A0A316D2K7_9BACL|nr:YaaC family protein [Tumebacillus permanentifrigoris]PWK05136.1 YaaC-like protein [Tumebacillus permanentifrigoris]
MQTQVRIPSEQPYRKLWDTFVYYENEQSASEYLRLQYERLGYDTISKWVYQATPKFIFSLKQAREYYRAAEACDILTKPLLLYYGMMALSKALITTHNPEYPSSTSVLKHGLSTRKLKRDQYSFAEDEVRVQKDGIFQTLHTTLQGPEFEPMHRFRMKELLAVIPELMHAYQRLYGTPQVCPLGVYWQAEQRPLWQVPRQFVAGGDRTREELLELLNRHGGESARFSYPEQREETGMFSIEVEGDHERHRLLLHDFSGQPHLRFPHEGDLVLPELSVHFMIMFVLGMLCRYETERWGEMILTFSSHDTFLINEFLNVSMRKFPNLILDELNQEQTIFYTP